MRDCFYLSTFICPSLFFFVFFNFSNKTVTWRVPENQLCTILEYDKKKKTIIQSIVLISGVPKGSVNNGLQCRIIADNFSFFFCLGQRASLIVWIIQCSLKGSLQVVPSTENKRVQIFKNNPWRSPHCSYVNIFKHIMCILKSEVE